MTYVIIETIQCDSGPDHILVKATRPNEELALSHCETLAIIQREVHGSGIIETAEDGAIFKFENLTLLYPVKWTVHKVDDDHTDPTIDPDKE